MRKFLSILLTALLIFVCAVPVIASAQDADVSVTAEQTTSAEDQQTCAEKFKSYFTDLFDKIKALFERLKAFFQVKNEKVECTMNKNAIHMLRSTQDTICDSFIIRPRSSSFDTLISFLSSRALILSAPAPRIIICSSPSPVATLTR